MSVDLEHVELLASLVYSGGASSSEESELAELLASSSEARTLASEIEDTMADLAMDLEWEKPPSGSLEALQNVLANDAQSIQSPSSDEAKGGANAAEVIAIGSRKSGSKTVTVLSTGLLFAAAAIFGLMWTQEKKRNEELSQRVDGLSHKVDGLQSDLVSVDREWNGRLSAFRATSETKLARLEMLRSPKLTLSTLGADSGATIKIFMEPEGKRWLVYGFDLPDLPDKDYQFWFVPKEGAPIPAGIFSSLGDGLHELEILLPEDITNITQAAVSLEPKGGSESPTEVQLIGPI